MRNQIFITDCFVIRIFVNNRVRHHKVARRGLNNREGDHKVARFHCRIVNIINCLFAHGYGQITRTLSMEDYCEEQTWVQGMDGRSF